MPWSPLQRQGVRACAREIVARQGAHVACGAIRLVRTDVYSAAARAEVAVPINGVLVALSPGQSPENSAPGDSLPSSDVKLRIIGAVVRPQGNAEVRTMLS